MSDRRIEAVQLQRQRRTDLESWLMIYCDVVTSQLCRTHSHTFSLSTGQETGSSELTCVDFVWLSGLARPIPPFSHTLSINDAARPMCLYSPCCSRKTVYVFGIGELSDFNIQPSTFYVVYGHLLEEGDLPFFLPSQHRTFPFSYAARFLLLRAGMDAKYCEEYVSLSACLTSSVKPEVHNVSQCRQRRIEPRPYSSTHKIDEARPSDFRVIRAADRQTNKQTDTLRHNTSHNRHILHCVHEKNCTPGQCTVELSSPNAS